MKKIELNRLEYLDLKEKYKIAKKKNKDIINFAGEQWITGYVKYLLQHLETKFKN